MSEPGLPPLDEKIKETAASKSAAAVDAPPSAENPAQELAKLGMPPIAEPIAKNDPSLADAVLAHVRWRFNSRLQRIENKPGYVVFCLRKPEQAGFIRHEDGRWETPPGQPPRAKSKESLLETVARIQASREEDDRLKAEMVDKESARILAWNARPEAVKEEIRAIVRSKNPLWFASAANDDFNFRCACMVTAEKRDSPRKEVPHG